MAEVKISKDINVNYTVPPEMLEERTVQRNDHGPFYLFTPALPIHRVDYKDSVPHIYPCELTVCTDWIEKLHKDHCPPGAAVQMTQERDRIGNVIHIATTVIPADSQRDLILEMYAEMGVVEIQAFAHEAKDKAMIEHFNSLIQPFRVEPWLELGDLQEKVEREGGLKVRQEMVQSAIDLVKDKNFLNKYGKERQHLFLQGIGECLASFTRAKSFCEKELGSSINEIKLRQAGADGKPTEDPRDAYFQWLLAKSPVGDNARASQVPQVVVQLPDNFQGQQGLSKADLLEIITKASEASVKAAMGAKKVE